VQLSDQFDEECNLVNGAVKCALNIAGHTIIQGVEGAFQGTSIIAVYSSVRGTIHQKQIL
jgi:hypothetical protein